ncbi:hypothetical protein ACVWYN_001302 [Pedobacter sp. UYP24]
MNKTVTNYSKLAATLLIGTALFSACKKEKLQELIDRVPTSTQGVYVLCEGAYGTVNNSSLTYYDITKKTFIKDYFKQQNGINLGSNANNLKQYGSKMYCTVTGADNVSGDSYLEVINIATGKSVKRIPFYNGTSDYFPRFVEFYKNKAYVSSYDGYISKIDTATLIIESRLKVGGALEGLAIVNGKLYVANSNHPFFISDNNSSVSVVDLNSFTKIKDIPVNFNPVRVAAATSGDLFTIVQGAYGNPALTPSLDKLSSLTDTKIQSYNYSLAAIAINGNAGYVIGNDYPATLKTFNISTGLIGNNFITDTTNPSSIYGVTINPLNNDVYVADATDYTGDGRFFCFSANGVKKFEFATGIAPQSAVFNYSYNK